MVVGGGIFWVGGRGWTFFMGEWGWVGLVVGIFCVGGGGRRFFLTRLGWWREGGVYL